MENMIQLPNIESLRFEGVYLSFDNQNPILNNVDFEFPKNEVVWIKSSEGAGKSSLLQVLAGLTTPQIGRYCLNGEDVMAMSFEEFLPYRLAIGYSFDYGGLISNRSLYDNLMLPLMYHKLVDVEQAKERIQDFEKRFELGKYMHERPAHVSGRIRKLTCLIRALVTWPQVLLMDDPSVGVGVETQQILFECISDLRQKGKLKHVFMSSYDDKFVRMFHPVVVHLEEGNLYIEGQRDQSGVIKKTISF